MLQGLGILIIIVSSIAGIIRLIEDGLHLVKYTQGVNGYYIGKRVLYNGKPYMIGRYSELGLTLIGEADVVRRISTTSVLFLN